MRIRRYEPSDWSEWRRMAMELFEGDTTEADEAEMRQTLAREDAAVFVLDREDGRLAGYVEAGARNYADGCATSPVGYIEAWFIDPDVRRSGHGRNLLAAAESWAVERGYTEMASDALLHNDVSHEAHKRSGYQEVERIVQFRKPLIRNDSSK